MRQSNTHEFQPGETNCIEGPTGTFTFYTDTEYAALQASSPITRQINVETFRKRFTDSELAAIATSTLPQVGVFVLKLSTRREDVDLDDPQFVQGLAYLVSVGLLAANRPAEILA